MFIRLTARHFRKLLSIYVFSSFRFGFEGRIWDLIESVPENCLSFNFTIVGHLSEFNLVSLVLCRVAAVKRLPVHQP